MIWSRLARAVTLDNGDPSWRWRRRFVFLSGLTYLSGIVHSIFWDFDLAHATMVMTNCTNGLTIVFAAYAAAAGIDDYAKRTAAASAGTKGA